MTNKIILGASIGNCVHVAGVSHFLNLAENEGYQTVFLGPAVSVDRLFDNIKKYKPYIVSIGYRLTPQNVIPLLEEIIVNKGKLDYEPIWTFGGTKPVAEIAKKYNIFSFCFRWYR